MKIVLDAMGGDDAPGVVIDGAVQAVKELDVEVVLVGREQDIQRELAQMPRQAPLEIDLGGGLPEPQADFLHPPPVGRSPSAPQRPSLVQ